MTSSKSALRESSCYDVLTWHWPDCPVVFNVYDKYANIETALKFGDAVWILSVQGRKETFTFAAREEGRLQNRLIILTQVRKSPSTISKFTRSLINKWPIYLDILRQGPDHVVKNWNNLVQDVDTAKAGKTILKLVCELELGEWREFHLAMVGGLDTRAKQGLSAQHRKIKRREKLLPVEVEAEVVRILDDAAIQTILPDKTLEGMAALALMYQHGMRPVQLLSLRLEHVPEPVIDAAGDAVMIVAFHTAKRGDKPPEEKACPVKPEWVSLISRQRTASIMAQQDRLFSVTSRDALLSIVRRACAAFGMTTKFIPYELRHTAAQSLADAGHDRVSIQKFLGHSNLNAANNYLRATPQQGSIVNKALGASKLYGRLLSISRDAFITDDVLRDAEEDMQIGGLVGGRPISGIGLCKSGQPSCSYNPVTSCYGCRKFMPVASLQPHMDAVAGIREQVKVYLSSAGGESSPALMQLTRALAGAQQALEMVSAINAEAG